MKNHDLEKFLKNGLKRSVPDVWGNIAGAEADNFSRPDNSIDEKNESYVLVNRYRNLIKYGTAAIIVAIISCAIIFSNVLNVNLPANSASPNSTPETTAYKTPTNSNPVATSYKTPNPTNTQSVNPTPDKTFEVPRSDISISPLEKSPVFEKAPEVETYFELLKEVKIDESFIAGFNVKLPRIMSDKPGAEQINNEINKIWDEVKSKDDSEDDLKDNDIYYKYYYDTFNFGSMIFINIRYQFSFLYGETDFYTRNFAYDFVNDKVLTNQDIARLYNLDLNQITEKINYIVWLLAKDEPDELLYVESPDNYYLYINQNGELLADTIRSVTRMVHQSINLVRNSPVS